MPFGLHNAGSVYLWILDLAMAHLPAEYWFIVIHKNGIENVNADALSRSYHSDESTKKENKEYQRQ
jgi:hypothetical protein